MAEESLYEYELVDIEFEEEQSLKIQEDCDVPVEVIYDHDGIPMGNSHEEIVIRRNIISSFYHRWKEENPELRRYNKSLKEDINIRFVSITETCAHACKTYKSTLAALHLDKILTDAKKVATIPAKKNSNQKPFDKMIVMECNLLEIGVAKMTVGIKRRTHDKIQYCITVPDGVEKKKTDNPKKNYLS